VRPQQVLRADDEPELLARVEDQADRSQVDLDLRDLTRLQLLHPVEAVRGNRIRGERFIQLPGGHAQAAVGTLVAQHRRAMLGDVLHYRALIGNRELLQVSSLRMRSHFSADEIRRQARKVADSPFRYWNSPRSFVVPVCVGV
jgi:hypothetical protein